MYGDGGENHGNVKWFLKTLLGNARFGFRKESAEYIVTKWQMRGTQRMCVATGNVGTIRTTAAADAFVEELWANFAALRLTQYKKSSSAAIGPNDVSTSQAARTCCRASYGSGCAAVDTRDDPHSSSVVVDR